MSKCVHPRLELDECDLTAGVDYYVCPDCYAVLEADCAFVHTFTVSRTPWEIPSPEELREVSE